MQLALASLTANRLSTTGRCICLTGGIESTSMYTFPRPCRPSKVPAPSVRSRSRSATNGPRSLIVTLIDRWFFGFETRIKVPIGNVLCAACQPIGLKLLPVETSLSSQYIEATTHSPAWMRSREFSLETLYIGIADNAPAHAKMIPTWANVRFVHATNAVFSTNFIGLIRRVIFAKAPRTASRPTEGETRN